MAAAKARLIDLRSSRYSPLTVEAYASDWKDFEEWCASAQKDALPANPETVALYFSVRLTTLKVSSIERRSAAIRARHLQAGFPAPITPMVKMVLQSARRKARHRPRQKAAISLSELLVVSQWLSRQGGLRCLRDRAAILFGFAAAFRRSDLAGLDLCDVDLVQDRVTVSLTRSKTDQQGRGRVLVIPRAKNPDLCCIGALNDWIVERGRKPGPLFVKLRHNGALTADRMRGGDVYSALKRAAKAAGLDATKFGAHSLRAGFVTASVDAGADVWDIMGTTGHKNIENLSLYVRRAVDRYPLRAVL